MIHARGLTRTFKAKKEIVPAVRGLDLDVAEGELVAFLGPNGAGKSTSLRMLTTLLPPTSGTATVAGFDIRTEPAQARRRLGYIGQGHGSGDYFRVGDELFTQCRAYGAGRREARERTAELLAVLELEPMAKRYAGSLSGGQRRRLDIAIGLAHRPRLLFMDEPSSGLDPQNRANLWEQILRLRQEFGTTILLTTHYLDEADAMAERVVVIDHGRVIADDTAVKLKAEVAGDSIVVTVGDPARAAEISRKVLSTKDIEVDGEQLTVRIDGSAAVELPGYLLELDRAGLTVRAAEVHRPTLDDVFLGLTGRSLRESA